MKATVWPDTEIARGELLQEWYEKLLITLTL